MVRNTVRKWNRKWKGIRKYHNQVSLSTMKALHAGWLIDCCNQLTSSHGKEIILAGWRASGISAAVEDGLIGFLIDPFNEIDPFDQTIEINITSVVRPISEEYINKEKVFNNYDSDDEFFNSENSDFNREQLLLAF